MSSSILLKYCSWRDYFSQCKFQLRSGWISHRHTLTMQVFHSITQWKLIVSLLHPRLKGSQVTVWLQSNPDLPPKSVLNLWAEAINWSEWPCSQCFRTIPSFVPASVWVDVYFFIWQMWSGSNYSFHLYTIKPISCFFCSFAVGWRISLGSMVMRAWKKSPLVTCHHHHQSLSWTTQTSFRPASMINLDTSVWKLVTLPRKMAPLHDVDLYVLCTAAQYMFRQHNDL